MTKSDDENLEARTTVALTGQIQAWLRTAGVPENGMSVDLADILSAARHVDELIASMLLLDPNNPLEADKALTHVGSMHAWLFTEMKPHLEMLREAWPTIEDRLASLGSPDDEDE